MEPSSMFYDPPCETCKSANSLCVQPMASKSACLHCVATKTRCSQVMEKDPPATEDLADEPCLSCSSDAQPCRRSGKSPRCMRCRDKHRRCSNVFRPTAASAPSVGPALFSKPPIPNSTCAPESDDRGSLPHIPPASLTAESAGVIHKTLPLQTPEQLFPPHLRDVLSGVAIAATPDWVAAFSSVSFNNIELHELTVLLEADLRERLALDFPDMSQGQRYILQEALREFPRYLNARDLR
ncbi:hypothetical protein C8R43DRAFT_966461 [Mycena crocata]|nr:hypothetical protein C8R43DRAFT_966461 [Mycena crocata]